MKKIFLTILAIALTACGSAPTSPITSGSVRPAAPQEPTLASSSISVLISGKSSKTILDAIQQNRTSRGMKLLSRSNYRIQFSQALPQSSPPTEVRMIYQLASENSHLRLSAQVLRITHPGRANEAVTDITRELASKLRDELESYTH